MFARHLTLMELMLGNEIICRISLEDPEALKSVVVNTSLGRYF